VAAAEQGLGEHHTRFSTQHTPRPPRASALTRVAVRVGFLISGARASRTGVDTNAEMTQRMQCASRAPQAGLARARADSDE
jgi:hypothetical protein